MTEVDLKRFEDEVGNGVLSEQVLALVAEVRRLCGALETTENLLGRAVTDSEAVELGRREERGRVLRLIDEVVEGSSTSKIDILFMIKCCVSDAGPILNPFPPEKLRNRIKALEYALEPFARFGQHLIDWSNLSPGVGVTPQEVYPDETVVRADLQAKPHELLPTVGDCRKAARLFYREET